MCENNSVSVFWLLSPVVVYAANLFQFSSVQCLSSYFWVHCGELISHLQNSKGHRVYKIDVPYLLYNV